MSLELESVLALDVGSTTTKARLIERTETGYRLTGRAEAPTTVEAPDEDVMVGVGESIRRLERAVGRRILNGQDVISPRRGDEGVDLLVATSSAGGGLQMTVTGLMNVLTGESAQRAALGAGAVVMDVISLDDKRIPLERIRRIQSMRPDIILIAGGTDGGNPSHVVSIAEYVAAARPRPRWGSEHKVPVIFAGNRSARDLVARLLADSTQLSMVDNIRPTMEQEHLEPVRDEIHRLFLDHVMKHAPGYESLMKATNAPIVPTPSAVGDMLEHMAETYGVNVIGIDIGGATTDIFSAFGDEFHRSVSANIGMSYSLGNVFVQSTPDRILRWLPFPYREEDLRDWNFNKMIRPTTLPEALDDLILEQAVGREAIRLSFEHHMTVAVGLKGIKVNRSFDNALDQTRTGQPVVTPGAIDVIVGSGGLISHAPRRSQAALMILDGIQPVGATRLYVDNVFMLPHLGVLARTAPDIARQVLVEDCLIPLGSCIAGGGTGRAGKPMARLIIEPQSGPVREETMVMGTLQVLPLGVGENVRVDIIPRGGFDFGAGRGKRATAYLHGGEVGLILDGRGRPVAFPSGPDRWRKAAGWYEAMDAYPEKILERYQDQYGREVR